MKNTEINCLLDSELRKTLLLSAIIALKENASEIQPLHIRRAIVLLNTIKSPNNLQLKKEVKVSRNAKYILQCAISLANKDGAARCHISHLLKAFKGGQGVSPTNSK